MTSSKENLSEVLRQVLRNRDAELHVSMPAVIISYDYVTRKARVKPTISRKYADGRIAPYPIISGVPVAQARSGGASLNMPVKAGDPVLLIFADRAIDDYLGSGGEQAQGDVRMHSLNDAVAITGMMPFSSEASAENNDDVLLKYDGNDLRLKPGGHSEIVSETSMTFKVGASTITLTPDGIVISAPRIDWN